jgi:hypothetical protein
MASAGAHAMVALVLLGFAVLGACAAPATSPSAPASVVPAALAAPAWFDAFDGLSLGGFVATDFGGQGTVTVRDGAIRLGIGSPLTGITWSGAVRSGDYELEVVGARELGNDFFCALTFPVGGAHLTLVLGGWGGSVCGLSSLDGLDASRNATRSVRRFERGRAYRAVVTVTRTRVAVALDGEHLCAVDPRAHALSLRPEVLLSRPLGVAAYGTAAAVYSVRWRPLPGAATVAPDPNAR